MKYIINGVLQYSSVDGTLYPVDHSQDMVTLNRVTSELLLLLINNNATPLSRDIILNELWVKKGLNASSNNLNNYISILRKALTHSGCPDLIITIPKYGFIFSADVVMVEHDDAISHEVHDTEKSWSGKVGKYSNIAVDNGVTIRSFSPKKIQVFLLLLVLMILCLSPLIYNKLSIQLQRTEIFSFAQCKFYLTDDTTRELDKIRTINIIKKIIKNENLNCNRKATVFYFSDMKRDVAGNVIKSDLLTYCIYGSKTPCVNYHVSKLENEDEKHH